MKKLGYTAEIDRVLSPTRRIHGSKVADQLKVDLAVPDHITFDENHVYSVVRAISSRVNLNADGFRREELLGAVEGHDAHNEKYGYRTFIGKTNHVDHFNMPEMAEEDPRHTPRGEILHAWYLEDDFDEPVMMNGFPDPTAKNLEDPVAKMAGKDAWVKLLIANDRRKFPVLCDAIEKGVVTKVSMGAEIIHSNCSVCGNTARHEFEYCDHARGGRGQVYAARHTSPFVQAGVIEAGDPILAFEDNHGLQFFEESWILDVQADPTAMILDLIQAEPAMSGPQVAAALGQVQKAAQFKEVKTAVESEQPKVNLQIDNVDSYLSQQNDAQAEGSEEQDEMEMDYAIPPNMQGGGPFAPDYPFPCSARYSASNANPDYPMDDTIDIEVCSGCMYNKDDRVGYVVCTFPDVVREGGKDPLPAGFESPEKTHHSGSGFRNEDGSPIEEFPGLEHPTGPYHPNHFGGP